MKQKLQSTIVLLLSLLLLLSFASCSEKIDAVGLWENATYLQDTELGKGAKTLVVEVAVAEQVVTFTLHTDAETVGDALLELGLIEGEAGAYGLYVKKVNGILADYDVDQSYWGFYVNGEYALTGVDGATIEEGCVYRLAYEK